jgi:WS/DGAT/MGAT family acyltransferase
MAKLRQLTPREVMFVGGETSKVYQHTAGLILLDASHRPAFGFDAFRRHVEERLDSVPHFRWKLHEVPLGLDLPYWVADENFSYDRHIRRIAVPSPGDHEALGDTVAYLYSRHLDRNKPLWEIWFIEGLADGRFAVVQKMHHCMMDGTGAVKLMDFMWDLEPDAAPRPVDPAIAKALPGEAPEPWQQSLNAAMRLSSMPMKIGREILDAARHSVSKRLSGKDDSHRSPTAPRTIFNADISSERGFVFGSLPLRDIKAVKKHFDVTLNDVVLAVVSGSLRDYLLERAALPDEPLRTSIAVSLRTDTDDEFSNRVTTASVTLATELADPVERLRTIAAEDVAAKAEARGGGKGVLEFVQLLPPVLVNVIMNMTPAEQVPRLAGVNVVVSNIRGSPTPMYVAGARVTAIYPMSIINPGGGLNITCISYADAVHFGATVEPNLIPEPWRIIQGMHKALGEYGAAIGKGAGRDEPASGKSGARKRKRAAVKKNAAAKRSASGRGKTGSRRATPAAKR